MKSKALKLWSILLTLILVGVGVTFALIARSSHTLNNVFAVGEIEITLTETTGNQYTLTPGVDIAKDPTVTVKAHSEKCLVFVKAQKSNDFDKYVTFAVADGWIKLPSENDVFYREVASSASDQSIPILSGNQVTVKETVTEEELNAITQKPKLTFYAYAIQSEGMQNAEYAWNIIKEKEE